MAKGSSTISDEAILKGTGKPRSHWYKVLDSFGARTKGHTPSAAHLASKTKLSGWWSQMITVEYERSRKIRVVGQNCRGEYETSVTRTIEAPAKRLWEAWAKGANMSKWFSSATRQDFREGGTYENSDGDRGTFKRIVPGLRVRFTWDNPTAYPGTVVEVMTEPAGRGRSKLIIAHMKLPHSGAVRRMKDGWSWAADCVKAWLETGKRISYAEWDKTKKAAPVKN